jgi:hypothetical protein
MIFFFHCKPKIINGIRVIMERNQRSDPRILVANIGKYGLNSSAKHLKRDLTFCPLLGGARGGYLFCGIFIFLSGKSNKPTPSVPLPRGEATLIFNLIFTFDL